MGNGCFCKTSDYIKDINLVSSSQQPIVNTKSEQVKQCLQILKLWWPQCLHITVDALNLVLKKESISSKDNIDGLRS